MVHILWRTFITGVQSVAVMAFPFLTLLRQPQVLPTPDSIHSFVVNDPVQSAQDLGNPPIAIAAMFAFIGLLADCFGQKPVLLRHLQFIPLRTAILPKSFARLSLADSQLLDDLFNYLPARSRAYQFFDATSLRMAFSMA